MKYRIIKKISLKEPQNHNILEHLGMISKKKILLFLIMFNYKF